MNLKILNESKLEEESSFLDKLKLSSINTINKLKKKVKKLLNNKWVSRSLILFICAILIVYFYYKMNGNNLSFTNITKYFKNEKHKIDIEKSNIDKDFISYLSDISKKETMLNLEESKNVYKKLSTLNLETRRYIFENSYKFRKLLKNLNINPIYVGSSGNKKLLDLPLWLKGWNEEKSNLDYEMDLINLLFPKDYIVANKKHLNFLPRFMMIEEDIFKKEICNLYTNNLNFRDFLKVNELEKVIENYIH